MFGSKNPSWKGGKREIACLHCAKSIRRHPSLIKTKNFCSRQCFGAYSKQDPNFASWNRGLVRTKEQREANSLAHIGKRMDDKHHAWKGVGVSYRSLHKWVERRLGKPTVCSHCSREGVGHQMHWANVSQKYLRDIKDWIRLCAKCHKDFDSNKLSLV